MPRIHVCSLALIRPTVAETGASHLVSLIKEGTPVTRPEAIAAERHLYLGFDDIIEPMEGMTAPAEEHVRDLLTFVDRWDRQQPMVVHCYAGISRSTAGAFISLCAVNPKRSEAEIAQRIRIASPTATPNARLVAFADRLLDRKGRMVEAIDAIGRGETAFEGVPFGIEVEE